MRRYLGFDSSSLAANLDPANLLNERLRSLRAPPAPWGRRIAHAHAKDARTAATSRVAQGIPLGHGDIDWMQFLAVLEEAEYHGWLAVERESGENRIADVANGVDFLRRLIG